MNKFCFVLLFFLSACAATQLDYEGMSLAENEFSERQSSELLALIPLEQMFQDDRARKLADAAARGDVTEVRDLVEAGANINYKGAQGATPLFWALRNSNLRGFTELLDLGASPNVAIAETTMMHWGVMHRDVRFLEALLRYGGNPNLVASRGGETPIFSAIGVAGNERLRAMNLLVQSGADVDAVNESQEFDGVMFGGETPMLVAANLGRFDLVLELLELGADYHATDVSGRGLVDSLNHYRRLLAPNSRRKNDFDRVIDWMSQQETTTKD